MRRILFSLLTLGVLLAGGYYLYINGAGTEAPVFTQPAASALSQGRHIPEGWLEYRNEYYGFSLLYPEYLLVALRDEGSGAATITFQNEERQEGFQLFIVPYFEDGISEERFRQDVPSGVREELQNITVADATGAMFYSEDATLGATREVWFLYRQFLYEATAPRPLEPLLTEVIGTWQFI